jgi:hypothetical protein
VIKKYRLEEKIWLYPGKAGWYFITVPAGIAKEIDFFFSHQKKGWGSLPVKVTIGKTTWKTSIFPDKKTQSYLLPLKAEVRQQEHLKEGNSVLFSIELTS